MYSIIGKLLLNSTAGNHETAKLQCTKNLKEYILQWQTNKYYFKANEIA